MTTDLTNYQLIFIICITKSTFININVINFSGPHMWEQVREPPLTKNLSVDEILNFRIKRFASNCLCHSQSVERNVALTSRCAKEVVGVKRQTGQQLVTASFRKVNPSQRQSAIFRKKAVEKARLRRLGKFQFCVLLLDNEREMLYDITN